MSHSAVTPCFYKGDKRVPLANYALIFLPFLMYLSQLSTVFLPVLATSRKSHTSFSEKFSGYAILPRKTHKSQTAGNPTNASQLTLQDRTDGSKGRRRHSHDWKEVQPLKLKKLRLG